MLEEGGVQFVKGMSWAGTHFVLKGSVESVHILKGNLYTPLEFLCRPPYSHNVGPCTHLGRGLNARGSGLLGMEDHDGGVNRLF